MWQDVLGPIFSSLVHCMATQTLVSVDSPWYTMMELSNQSRKKAGPLFLSFFFSVLALAYCLQQCLSSHVGKN